MIHVGSLEKKDCNGCNACGDICGVKAITYQKDNEGFWYPKVDEGLCTSCNLCVKICPEINSEEVNKTNEIEPVCFGAYYKDQEIRSDSTSGGLFSALANKMYEMGGYVGGAIYNEDFSVRHIISNNNDDLAKIRSSKYLQSNCIGLHKEVKRLLIQGESVLVCGCPCQMSALRLFLRKSYDRLIICDFICRGINSPKIFRSHLDSLEHRYQSKIVYAKAKNKELGWRALTFKATFENGESYYGTGNVDNFTRGYLQTGAYCRPSCYDCKFKKIPRISDITLADFWGVENINPDLDNNTGTSAVMCNSEKGLSFFDSIKANIVYSQVTIGNIKSGNPSLLKSLAPPVINRESFFKDIEQMPYHEVAKKYFLEATKSQKIKFMIKKGLRFAITLCNLTRINPRALWQFIRINFLRKSTNRFAHKFLFPTPYSVFDLHKRAKVNISGNFMFGLNKVKGSRLETRLKMDEDSTFNIKGDFSLFAGVDIQLFKGGELTIEGDNASGCNIYGQIVCADKITIGKGTLIGRNVVIRDYDAHYIKLKNYKVSAPINIGNRVWIGDGAMIAKGVTIGDGAIIAARSWVVSNVAPRTLVGGSPAVPLEKDIEWEF